MRAALALCAALACPAGAREIGAEALDSLPQVDVVVLGEVHDNPAHHAHQARAVRALDPAALVFEMLQPAQVAALPDDLSDAAAVAAATDWEARGWPDFAMYHPIFLAAPEARIYAGDVPRSVVRMAIRDGAAAAFGAEAARYGLTVPFGADMQAAQEQALLAAHCYAMPSDALAGMVEAQRLRDAVLAQAAMTALRETGGPVAVITGVEHARTDIGVPALIRLADPSVTVLSVGQMETVPEGRPPHDLWIVTDGVKDRGDPCEGFGSTEG
ncbi:ChaN family lipoprotein [Rhodobacteraceae bacterium HSP-20]|uniref:ChaN family lipoprotein n=1 Tax=Paragemmobacter amnigenus TaxID=2852097 RepID=A0ABS6J813_9RHOB|nr:ChaN family lipoprotein [Rhodobacter amnigenus]MBU9699881.1 ChaN family lipoprotein [Rhodobacter amnigenus]MBV4391108.1 ChaN family lipoprotein [Rhodobacter amnigenus]